MIAEVTFGNVDATSPHYRDGEDVGTITRNEVSSSRIASLHVHNDLGKQTVRASIFLYAFLQHVIWRRVDIVGADNNQAQWRAFNFQTAAELHLLHLQPGIRAVYGSNEPGYPLARASIT